MIVEVYLASTIFSLTFVEIRNTSNTKTETETPMQSNWLIKSLQMR